MSRRAYVGCLAIFLVGWLAKPQVAEGDELRWTHFGLRPLGMGNAFVAVADDYNALFYNPAGLARLNEWDGEVLNPAVEISKNTLDFLDDVQKFAQGSAGEVDAVLDLLEPQIGKTHHGRLTLTPHLIFKHFGFAVGLDLLLQMVVHRNVSIDLKAGPQIIAPFGFAFNFLENRLSVGGAVKFLAAGGVDQEFSIEEISAFSDESESEGEGPELEDYVLGGVGAGVDFGVLFTPVKTMNPTLGLSVTDLGGSTYDKLDVSGEALGTPPTRLPSVNVGFSLTPWELNGMYLLTAIDAHAINQPVHYSKKLNMGLEWGYRKIIKLQTGLHQGAATAGMQFDVGLLNLRLVTYEEQRGPVSGQDENLADRRYAVQVKLLL